MTDVDIQARLSRLKEQVKGILTEIEEIEDHFGTPKIRGELPARTYENQVPGEPLLVWSEEYAPRPPRRVMPLRMVIQEGIDHGMKNPPGVNGYKKPESGEYVEGPEPTWVSQLKVPISKNLGSKEPKTVLLSADKGYCR